MSDMQLYLIALGAIFIAAVIMFNWWQERRLSQDAIRRFDGPADDALMDDIRIEPEVSDEPEISLPDEGLQDVYVDDAASSELEEPSISAYSEDTLLSELPGTSEAYAETVGDPIDDVELESLSSQQDNSDFDTPVKDAAGEADSELVQEPELALPDSMDPLIDLIAIVHLHEPVTGSALRELLQPLPAFDKTSQWFGRDASGQWQPLIREHEQMGFDLLAASLQFADRSGVVSSRSLRNFHLKLEAVAEKLGARLEWRTSGDPARYAADIDQFCIDVDVMVGFHIAQGSNGPFAATKLRGLAEAGGMTLNEDGSFHYVNEAGETLFTLINQDHRPFTPETLRTAFIRGISFQMDVPRVRNCPETFSQMATLARKMESSLGGMLIDDNQLPLSQASIDMIRDQLRIIYAKMVARGIIPGSATALRLFS